MSAESLKERMQEFAAGKIGAVRVTSEDLTGGGGAAGGGSGSDSGGSGGSGGTKGTVKAPVPEAAKNDTFAQASDAADIHKAMSPGGFATSVQVDITEEDRAAFMHALVTGGRYERTFSLFGGRLTGVFRCRKIAESDGIIAWISHCVNHKQVDARIEYLTLMRNAMLAAQVKSLRGLVNEDFPELKGPYGPTRVVDGDKGDRVVEPGWVAAAESWGSRPEALVTALHNELQLFEQRYWTMVMDASNQNFWNPAASI